LTLAAQVAGPNYPNAFSNAFLTGYSQQWTDISNVQYEDETYASFGNLPGVSGSHTDYLVATDFGFQIPAGTIITGIKAEVKCFDPNSRTSDFSVRIVKTGNISGAEKAMSTPYPVGDNYITYGGPNDLWGETWDYKFIDDNHFGLAIAAQRNSDDDIITAGVVNNIRITVYYTYTTLPLKLVEFSVSRISHSVKLSWKTMNESGMEKFILERSSNGYHFQPIAELPALNRQVSDYSWLDASPLRGFSYYRLKMEGEAGYRNYSGVVSVKTEKLNQLFLFPNPWNKNLELQITNDANEKLTVCFYSIGGNQLSTAVTETKLVPTETLLNRKGLLYYKIFDSAKNLIGWGSLLISL
ncbi:MAG TPA: hypothetical protein VN451_10440, partial [Chitinophagaceae bacterium]|nr:hypothetical protein [Chitinophagaceae bacterium]